GLYIDIGATHYNLSLQCMTWMVKLLKKENICNLDPFKLYSDIPNLKELQDQKIPKHLTYSCNYWVSHLISSGNHWIGNEANRQKLLTDVCTKKLLFWIEVMSILGKTKAAIQAMYHLSEWCHAQHLKLLATQLGDPFQENLSASVFKRLSQLSYDV